MNILELEAGLTWFMNVAFTDDHRLFNASAANYEVSFSVKTRLFDDPEDALCHMALNQIVTWAFKDFPFLDRNDPSYPGNGCYVRWASSPQIVKDINDCAIHARISFIKR